MAFGGCWADLKGKKVQGEEGSKREILSFWEYFGRMFAIQLLALNADGVTGKTSTVHSSNVQLKQGDL